MNTVRCDAVAGCTGKLAYVDAKGWCYCAEHGLDFKLFGRRVRKLRPAEIRTIEAGGKIN